MFNSSDISLYDALYDFSSWYLFLTAGFFGLSWYFIFLAGKSFSCLVDNRFFFSSYGILGISSTVNFYKLHLKVQSQWETLKYCNKLILHDFPVGAMYVRPISQSSFFCGALTCIIWLLNLKRGNTLTNIIEKINS